MNSVFILLNSLNDWKPYCETDSLMTVTDYLEHRYGERTPKLVINLSDEYGCNSEGYYCSLLAQARGHRVLPGVETLNKLESGAGIPHEPQPATALPTVDRTQPHHRRNLAAEHLLRNLPRRVWRRSRGSSSTTTPARSCA